MPMRPRSGSRDVVRHMKSWSSSSIDGALNENIWVACGSIPAMTCAMAPSFPAASMPWKITSTLHRFIA
jgi:hypothetical protein